MDSSEPEPPNSLTQRVRTYDATPDELTRRAGLANT